MNSIQSLISTAIKTLYGVDFTPEISPAPKAELGEYCIGVFQLAKPVGKAPNMIAAELAIELAKHTDTFTSTNSIGGYVNFFLADSVWLNLFSVTARNEAVLSPETRSLHTSRGQNQQTIVVDYIGANVGKPLHIGHICTPSIGQVVCNVYRHLGYRVIGDSHFGDWGGIFGKIIYVWENITILSRLEEDKYGDYFTLKNIATALWKEQQLEKYGIEFLLDLYKAFHITLPSIPEEGTPTDDDLGARLEFQYLSGVGIDLSNPEELKHHEENVELWKKFTSISITETNKKLELLNVGWENKESEPSKFYNIGESFYEGLNLPRPNDEKYPDLKFTMKDTVKELIDKGIATDNSILTNGEDKSVGVVFPEESKLPSCILQKKDGTGLYLTSDLAAIKYRLTNGWNPSKIIYSVDVRQQLHLKQAFWIARAAWGEEFGANNVEFFHAFNGFIKLKEGAMSTRHGTVIFLEALINEGNERTGKILAEKGRTGDKSLNPADIQAITVGAIKYSYLAQDREKDVVFDWDKALNFEGNSGPYIQYAYVRARKIGGSSPSRGGQEGYSQDTSPTPSYKEGKENTKLQASSSLKLSSYDKFLIQSLARFDETVAKTAETYKPHHLALYAYELAVTFNSFYVHTPKILEEKDENLRNLRLTLVARTAETLEKAFELLGIQMPSEM